MVTLSLRKKPTSPSAYQQNIRWKLTTDMHDTLEKEGHVDDIMDVRLLVTLKNGEQKLVEV
jgi:hypothetical protein